jgi:hypothetical protein
MSSAIAPLADCASRSASLYDLKLWVQKPRRAADIVLAYQTLRPANGHERSGKRLEGVTQFTSQGAFTGERNLSGPVDEVSRAIFGIVPGAGCRGAQPTLSVVRRKVDTQIF